MNQNTHADFLSLFDETGISQSPSEVHGLLTGMVCVSPDSDIAAQHRAFQTWFEDELDQGVAEQLSDLFTETRAALDEYGDFQFHILMPLDSVDIDTRSKSLRAFCSGFLSGFGLAGHSASSQEDVAEALSDFERIAAFRDDVTDSEENEADLQEIIEYVRVSVLLIFATCDEADRAERRGSGR